MGINRKAMPMREKVQARTAVQISSCKLKVDMCKSERPVIPSPNATIQRASTFWVRRPTIGSARMVKMLPGESTSPLSKAV